jgi:hypothetical protein
LALWVTLCLLEPELIQRLLFVPQAAQILATTKVAQFALEAMLAEALLPKDLTVVLVSMGVHDQRLVAELLR